MLGLPDVLLLPVLFMSAARPLTIRLPVAAAALLLSACAAQRPQPPASAIAPAQPALVATPPGAPLAECVERLRPAALAAGVQALTLERHLADLSVDAEVLSRLDKQPEFSLPIWDYLAGLVDEERIEAGREKLQQHQDVLAQISSRYGVPAEAVVAVWGIESNFGQTTGSYPLLRSLTTLSCLGRRQAFFRGELFATLRILQSGDVASGQLIGSWAGAFGQTQFMPTTYERLAVDHDGDGRRDLIASVPDALASTARFLRDAGWRSGQPWGLEVRLPAGFDARGESRRNTRPLSAWMTRGLTRVDGSPLLSPASQQPQPPERGSQEALSAATPAGLMLPAGVNGPAFLVLRNFNAFYRYNAAESYGLAIAHLSDRLRGEPAFATPWPTDDPGLSRAQRRQLQELLVRRGHDIGEIDGRLGERSRAAIRAEQQRLGQPATGRGGQKLLLALRED